MVINLYRYQLPLTQPLSLAGREIRCREGLFIQINEHWGDIAPLPNVDITVIEQDARQAGERLRQGLPHSARQPAVQFGLDCALAKVPVAPSLSLSTANTANSLPLLEGPRDPLVRAWRCRRVHPSLAWLTLTGSIHYDAGLIRELCLLAPNARLVLDAGGHFTPDYLQDLWSRIDGQRIDWILDPGHQLHEAQTLSEQHIPVALDLARYPEALTKNETQLTPFSFAKALLLRPSQLGGLSYNQNLVSQARALGLAVMIGDSLQSGLGQRQLAHLSSQWLADAPLALGRCRYLLDSGIDEQGRPQITGLTPL